MLYLLVYTFMNLGIFAVIILLNRGADVGEPLEDFSGLAKSHAGLAFSYPVFPVFPGWHSADRGIFC